MPIMAYTQWWWNIQKLAWKKYGFRLIRKGTNLRNASGPFVKSPNTIFGSSKADHLRQGLFSISICRRFIRALCLGNYFKPDVDVVNEGSVRQSSHQNSVIF